MSDLASLNARARLIFRQIVEGYLETGAPVGSRLLSEVLEPQLSPASIRATMAELERSGLLYAPHVSAGRLPTQSGLRLFIDGLLQVSELTAEERDIIAPDTQADLGAEQLLKQAVDSLSGLSQCAGLVLSPGADPIIKHIEFTPISDDQILVILVDEANQVENRVIAKPRDLLPATLAEVSNYLNTRLKGRTLEELRREAQSELEHLRTELGELTAQIVAAGGGALGRRGDDERPSPGTPAKTPGGGGGGRL
ncbi:MAG TPA: heat-inducible transcriptional repressor HrcA, partial [Rhodobiaceae bacterium]|nr:heat-inducible transcriptional repressor HrcA [Rhodobiaceae bacterium]